MIRSMTGYGSSKGVSGKVELSIEVKSVNSRYLDCTIKLPRGFAVYEEILKSLVTSYISRGKVDVYVNIDASKADDIEVKVNKSLANAYISSLRELANEFGLNGNINVMELARFPDILSIEKREIDAEQLGVELCSVLAQALESFTDMRTIEGNSMRIDITSRLNEIERLTLEAERISPSIVADYTSRLKTRISEFLQTSDIDDQRILTEAAIFADRIANNEEVVRLKSHVAQLRVLLESGEPIGRKIDFLVQEFNREANTIGSKGNDAEMAKITVDLKAEIEKIREQAQNIE